MQVSNEGELRAYLQTILMSALEDTMNELLDKLEEYITVDVYIAHNPTFYDRTMEFMQSWRMYSSKNTGDIWAEIYQDDGVMDFNPEMWQHGSWYSMRLPAGKLADIINSGNIGNIANFPQLGARPFWNDFSNYCDNNFLTIFQKHCRNKGLMGVF